MLSGLVRRSAEVIAGYAGGEPSAGAGADNPTPAIGGGSATEPPAGGRKLPQTGGIALALGGGIAKGWAHIGVLRAFDEAKIPISMIAGTSIGALAGGCYLAGKLDALEEFARSLRWTSVLRFMDFAIAGSGLISGMRLAARMSEHLEGVKIEGLTSPFVCICTDIRTGHEIWLHDGPLIAAIRASYALPGVFAPVEHNGRLLVDGALVNPVPVSACRAYEPDVVIAVSLHSEAFGRAGVIRSSHYDELARLSQTHKPIRSIAASETSEADAPAAGARIPRRAPAKLGVTGVMIEAFNIIQDRIERARMAGDPPDYTIRPRLADIGLVDFHRAAESIRQGYEETLRRLRELEDAGALERFSAAP